MPRHYVKRANVLNYECHALVSIGCHSSSRVIIALVHAAAPMHRHAMATSSWLYATASVQKCVLRTRTARTADKGDMETHSCSATCVSRLRPTYAKTCTDKDKTKT